MSPGGILFLAAYTDRSRAYAQAMAKASPLRVWTLLFGDRASDKPRRSPACGAIAGCGELFLPDLGEPLEVTCAQADWNVTRSAAEDVNHPDISRRLAEARPSLVVYSGYGGQLVGGQILDLGFDFLHLHAGWLPDYRGSTTIYYSWLKEGRCAVTALILDKAIDTGPIIARRHYPAPPPGLDVDRHYDSAIRADLLVDVLRDFSVEGNLPRLANEGGGMTYYVIHPVLKHLALLSREPA